jgi:hypothetical protein
MHFPKSALHIKMFALQKNVCTAEKCLHCRKTFVLQKNVCAVENCLRIRKMFAQQENVLRKPKMFAQAKKVRASGKLLGKPKHATHLPWSALCGLCLLFSLVKNRRSLRSISQQPDLVSKNC